MVDLCCVCFYTIDWALRTWLITLPYKLDLRENHELELNALLPQDNVQHPCLAEKLSQRRPESLEKPLGISQSIMPKSVLFALKKRERERKTCSLSSRNLHPCCCNRCVSVVRSVRRYIWLVELIHSSSVSMLSSPSTLFPTLPDHSIWSEIYR